MRHRIQNKMNITLTALITTLTVFLSAPFARALDTSKNSEVLAAALIQRGGVHRGLCVVLGIDQDFPLQLAQLSELLVHARDPRGDAVYGLRKTADAAGLGINRLTAEQGNFERLPYAENTVDLLITANADDSTLNKLSPEEILRVLRPEGIAIIGDRIPEGQSATKSEQMQAWLRRAGTVEAQLIPGWTGSWVQLRKPPLKGADDWSHWEKGPDNNPVSNDQIIKAPYMTQFLANPLYIGMPSITTAAGGRTFLAVGHIAHHEREWEGLQKIIARNGYNGTILWERDLPKNYLVHRSAFIATKDTFHMIDGNRCLLLDAQTGIEKGEIRIPGLTGEWKWMAMRDGVLYAMAGKRERGTEITKGDRTFGGWSWADLSKGYYGNQIPFGFGDSLSAFDIESKQRLWIHREEKPIDSRGMALQGNKVFLYCPDAHLRCLDSRSGATVWTNADQAVLGLIEKPGRRLISTPGFRTACLAVATPDALIIQGQTRMNVIGVSTLDGHLLWSKNKITNNPNAIYVDDKVVLGVGERGSHLVVDPVTGNVEEDLKFFKAACTRLTASPDSFFCRGEGTLRFDRSDKKTLIDGSVRPGCNDGALPANGMLYLGPWQCDCNLSIIGNVGKCSAGDFRFDHLATEADNLQVQQSNFQPIASLPISDLDWPTYRANNHRSTSSNAKLAIPAVLQWQFSPDLPTTPTAATAVAGMLFSTGNDGKIRAINTSDGSSEWEYLTPAPIKFPPTIWEGCAYVGGGDGYVYCLDATTGRLLWRFRAAPIERHMMVYGNLSSTWPVHSGVLVHDGVAYAAAGIIDQDGTYVYALDAKTGKIKWQNNSSGHLNLELRKGVSVQGNLSIQGNHLLLAGGNQVSPARFDLRTGQCSARSFDQGKPKANNGQYVGVLKGDTVIVGGRILHSAPENVSTKGSFQMYNKKRGLRLNYGAIPPAWDNDTVAFVNYKRGRLTACDTDTIISRITQETAIDTRRTDRNRLVTLAQLLEVQRGTRWQTEMKQFDEFEVVSIALCPNAVVSVAQYQIRNRAQSQWWILAFDRETGKQILRREIRGEPLPGGLLINRRGQAIVSMLDGNILCFGPRG